MNLPFWGPIKRNLPLWFQLHKLSSVPQNALDLAQAGSSPRNVWDLASSGPTSLLLFYYFLPLRSLSTFPLSWPNKFDKSITRLLISYISDITNLFPWKMTLFPHLAHEHLIWACVSSLMASGRTPGFCKHPSTSQTTCARQPFIYDFKGSSSSLTQSLLSFVFSSWPSYSSSLLPPWSHFQLR